MPISKAWGEFMKLKRSGIAAISVSAVIVAIFLALTVAVGALHGLIDDYLIGYKDTEETSKARAAGAELLDQIQREGTVLVRNEKNEGESRAVLPLDRSVTKLNVFGWSSVDWVYGGSGSGRVEGTRTRDDDTQTQLYDFYDALEAYGVEYNRALRDFYTDYKQRRDHADPFGEVSTQQSVGGGLGTLHSFNYEFSMLYEPALTQEIKEGAIAYSRTALVVLGRVSGESNDSPKKQYKYRADTDSGRTYLEISAEEEELLRFAGSEFENVIVLINSTNVMELGFLETIPGLDACLLVMTTGTSGANAIPALLYGEDAEGEPVSPSGRTADTWAYDLRTSPTYATVGSGIKGAGGQGDDTTNFYTNADGLYPTGTEHLNGSSNVNYSGVAYTDYLENIYVGYKWYETADREGFWSGDFAETNFHVSGYDEVVQFPFGFGLSYTDFAWKVISVKINGEPAADEQEIKSGDVITFEVNVTNVGNFPGQDVVELFYTPPYTGSGVEKSDVNLIAFAKTQNVLVPQGEENEEKGIFSSETVTLTVKVSDMKSYDYLGLAVEEPGYVLEGGEYTLSLRTDAHTLASDGEHARLDANAARTFRFAQTTRLDDPETRAEVENRFTGEHTTDGVAIDGNSDGSAAIRYLTRGNGFADFPLERPADRAMTDEIRARNTFSEAMAAEWMSKHPEDRTYQDSVGGGEMITETVNGVVVLTDYGRQFADEENYENNVLWRELIDRLTPTELQDLVLHGYLQTCAIRSIGKPETKEVDGPNQIGSFDNSEKGTTGFSSVVLAQSFNTELAYSMGLAVGREAQAKGIRGWYGPAMNLHRSPFGGRNFEYYSEDPYLSGIMAARSVEAAKNCGVYSYLKHLCLYESESGRDGMYNWITEQALREVYIRPFEICIKEGGATGLMTSYGRIGAVWTGGSEALLCELVRGEWGFKGTVLTDYADYFDFMSGDHMLRGGGDVWMDHWDDTGEFAFPAELQTNEIKRELRRAAKNVVYTYTNALLSQEIYNEKIESGKVDGVPVLPGSREMNFRWYIPLIVSLDAVALGGCAVWLYFALRKKK